MTLPLYLDAATARKGHRDGNAGLRFQRFYDGYQHDAEAGAWIIRKEKKPWLDRIKGPVGDPDALERHALALARLARARRGIALVLKASTPFVTGTGYPHPAEDGFSFHPVLGTPYLPGSAVEGLLRAWIEAWDDDSPDADDRRRLLLDWFGSEDKDPSGRGQDGLAAGGLIFFDAVPVRRPVLRVDIATPHLGKWYEQGQNLADTGGGRLDPARVPADWHDPNPIPFLVADNLELLFCIAPRGPLGDEAGRKEAQRERVEQAMDKLAQALDWIGVGAKTAVGYGLFQRDSAAGERLHQQLEALEATARRARLTPGQQQIDTLEQAYARAKAARPVQPGDKIMQDLAAAIRDGVARADARDREALAAFAEGVYKAVGWGKKDKRQAKKAAIEALRR